MFSSKIAFCCIVALHFTSSGASPVQEMYALQSADFEPAAADAFLSIKITGSNNRNDIKFSGSGVAASGGLRVYVDGSNNVNAIAIDDPSLRPADRRLQFLFTGSNNVNTVIVNGSPWQIY